MKYLLLLLVLSGCATKMDRMERALDFCTKVCSSCNQIIGKLTVDIVTGEFQKCECQDNK